MSFWLYLRDGTLCVTGQYSGYTLHYLRVTRKIWHYNTLWMISICNGTCLTNIYTVIEPLVWHFKNPTCSICILVAYIGALAYICRSIVFCRTNIWYLTNICMILWYIYILFDIANVFIYIGYYASIWIPVCYPPAATAQAPANCVHPSWGALARTGSFVCQSRLLPGDPSHRWHELGCGSAAISKQSWWIMSWNLSRTSQTLKISKGGNADMSLTCLMFSVGGKGVHCHERPQHRECGSWPGVLVSLHKHKRGCGLDWIPHRSWPWQTAGKQIKTTDTHQPWQYALESLATFGQVQLCFLNWLGRRRPSNTSTEECNLIRVSAIGFTYLYIEKCIGPWYDRFLDRLLKCRSYLMRSSWTPMMKMRWLMQ